VNGVRKMVGGLWTVIKKHEAFVSVIDGEGGDETFLGRSSMVLTIYFMYINIIDTTERYRILSLYDWCLQPCSIPLVKREVETISGLGCQPKARTSLKFHNSMMQHKCCNPQTFLCPF
jgi:hypothetical protein